MDSTFSAPWRYVLFTLVLYGASQSYAQSISRQSINSLGSYQHANGLYVRQTVGQAYQTKSITDAGVSARPGFQQPITFEVRSSGIKSSLEMDIAVFPNPATTSISLQSSEGIEQAYLRIVDIKGNIILDRQIKHFQKEEILCTDWSKGIYILSLSNQQNQKYTSKLIITK